MLLMASRPIDGMSRVTVRGMSLLVPWDTDHPSPYFQACITAYKEVFGDFPAKARLVMSNASFGFVIVEE